MTVATNPYIKEVVSVCGAFRFKVDVYGVVRAYHGSEADVALVHAIKKVLMPGKRGDKTYVQDLEEAIVSLQSAVAFAKAQENMVIQQQIEAAKEQADVKKELETYANELRDYTKKMYPTIHFDFSKITEAVLGSSGEMYPATKTNAVLTPNPDRPKFEERSQPKYKQGEIVKQCGMHFVKTDAKLCVTEQLTSYAVPEKPMYYYRCYFLNDPQKFLYQFREDELSPAT